MPLPRNKRMMGQNITGLPGAELWNKLFPFYLCIDTELYLCAMGPSAHRLFLHSEGKAFFDVFEIMRATYDLDGDDGQGMNTLRSKIGTLFIIRSRENGVLMRGQLLETSDGKIWFFGSPWFNQPEEMSRFGLTLSDFALQDPTVDLLFMTQAREMDNRDLRELNRQLKTKNQQLGDALDLQKVLYREIHHRVRNNLQTITSLINLRLNEGEAGQARGVLLESIGQIKSIALIHSHLLDGSAGKIELEGYMRELLDELLRLKGDLHPQSLILKGGSFSISADAAIYLGLIVHELVLNSFKHGKHEDLNIHIALSQELDKIWLRFRDNGKAEAVGGEQKASYGTRLIHILQQQLKAEGGFGAGRPNIYEIAIPL